MILLLHVCVSCLWLHINCDLYNGAEMSLKWSLKWHLPRNAEWSETTVRPFYAVCWSEETIHTAKSRYPVKGSRVYPMMVLPL